jgi:hypothetical protein
MTATLSSDAAAVMTAHLAPGERLLWAGRPKQGFALRGWDIVYWPLSLLMVVAGTYITVVEWRKPGATGTLIFVLLWTAAAYYAAFGRFFMDRWQRSLTYYAVTDRRAIILTRENPDYIQSINLSTLKKVTYSRRSDNTGTLEFDRPSVFTFQGRLDTARGSSFPSMQPELTPAFEMIADARQVRDLIEQTQQALQAP